jgi:hypothetical protein
VRPLNVFRAARRLFARERETVDGGDLSRLFASILPARRIDASFPSTW